MHTKELIEYFEKKYGKLDELDWIDELDWEVISCSEDPCLTEEFMREFKDNVDWSCISSYQKLSEEFIREFKDKVDWFWISYYQKLSCEFIEEFIDKIDINGFNKHNKINYLKYKLKHNKISNKEYLKELICAKN